MKIKIALILFFLYSSVPVSSFGEDKSNKGFEIAKKADGVQNGYQDQEVEMEMHLISASGELSKRNLKLKSKEVDGDGDMVLLYFSSPLDIKGTAFLSHSHATEASDQWIFLPALKRVKRISSNNQSGSFMGSEFSYEDLASQEIEKFRYKFLKSGKLKGKKVHVVQRVPKDKNSGYSRHVVYYDAEKYIPLKVEYYDRKKKKFKSLSYRSYKEYPGKIFRAKELMMVNLQTKKKTKIVRGDFKFKVGFTKRDFHHASLSRVR